MITQEDIKLLPCGLISCWWYDAVKYMHSLRPILESAPISVEQRDNYYVDVKVHMLMPGMYPCIPNWHYDAIPRDADGIQQPELVDPSKKMYLWLSNPPITEFDDGRKVNPMEWVEFTQLDAHRGVQSDKHQWRLFIRLMPKELVASPRTGLDAMRTHSQVYLDAKEFSW